MSRVLSSYRQGVLLFVLHFNSAPAIFATWTRGGTRFSTFPLPSLLPLFLVFLIFLSLSLYPSPPLPRALSSFCSSPSHRRWSFRTRGDTSRPWRTCSPRATSILTHPQCKSTNAFCASGTHAIQRVLLRWVL